MTRQPTQPTKQERAVPAGGPLTSEVEAGTAETLTFQPRQYSSRRTVDTSGNAGPYARTRR